MDVDRWRRVEQVLDAALTREPAQWPSLLDESCSGDPELRREVEALLGRLTTARGFLESPPVALAAALVAEAREAGIPSQEGRRLGAYRIVREIGRGGMARVFLAERADGQFEQQVALKLLRPGLDSEIDQERFRAERQILASLSHPNIARLLDGGVTDEGQPYLVIEHVNGQPIDVFCDQGGLSIRQRLELFLTVCEATQYAHRNLVVHRDLKPSNILVSVDGTVKLLDFGLAKLLEPGAQPAESPITRTGQRWMTPEYAAPEQIRGQPVTTLTDVYQLGAVLYQLLAGQPPFAGRSGSLHQLEEAVLQANPEPPSAVARQLPGLNKPLRGDLDAIVLKTLRKEPEERFASVEALADDLRRHMSGHPVLARRQTVGYRARRFVRRHRLSLAAAAVILFLLGAYAVTVTIQRQQIERALTEAQFGTRKAEQVTDFMLGLFEAAEGGKALTDTVTAKELLSRGIAGAGELSGQPELQAQMLDVIGRLYTQLGEYDRARPLLQQALAIRRQLHGEGHADVVTSLENLARVTELKQDIKETINLRRQVLALRRRISGTENPKTSDALYDLSLALHQAGDDSAASPLFEEWMSAVAGRPRERTAASADRLTSAANLLTLRGHLDRAEPMLREALVIRRELYGGRHHLVASSLTDLGLLLDRARRPDDAERLLREAVELLRATYPDGHPQLAGTLRFWAQVLEHLERFQEAEAPLRQAIALRRRFTGENTIDVAMGEMDLAYALTMSGRYEESASLARDAIRILQTELGENNAMVFRARTRLGDALRGEGNYAEAEPLLLASYGRFAIPNSVTRPWRAAALHALVRLYEAQGRTEDAAKYRGLLSSPSPQPTKTNP